MQVAPPVVHVHSVFCEHLPTEAGVGHLLLTAVPLPWATVKSTVFLNLCTDLSDFIDEQMCALPKTVDLRFMWMILDLCKKQYLI